MTPFPPSQLSYADHVAATRREIGLLRDALAAGPLDAPVPTCPDWVVRDLAKHVGEFCGFWAHVLCEGTGAAKTPFADAPPADAPDADWVAWFDGLAGQLVAALEATPPTTEVWTWVEHDKTAAFTARRCANELAIHRVDAQSARDAIEPVDAALAADGIEEIFVMMANHDAPESRSRTAGQTLHLHGTDPDRSDEWLLTLTPDGVLVERAHAKGDLALRGSVSDLEQLLYQRPTLGPVERFGDESVLDLWYASFTFG